MANKNKKPAAKPAATNKALKAPTKPVKPAPKEEVITPETVETTGPASQKRTKPVADVTVGELATGTARKGLSPDSLVKLNDQLMDLFVRNPKASDRWGTDLVEAMIDITAINATTALIDEAVNGNSTFAITIKKVGYNKLATAAKCLGVELPPENKLLAGPTEDTVQIASEQIVVSEETAAAAKEEHETETKGAKGEIELDPVKVAEMGEDALKEALNYLLVTGPKQAHMSTKDTFTKVIDFMHDYRIAMARKAENSTDAMNAIENRSMKEWYDDIFHYVKPTLWITGIGKGLYVTTASTGNPLKAFLILRGALIDKETKKCCWDDQSIADTVSYLIEMMANNNIAAEQKAIDETDKNGKGYRDVVAKHEAEIAKNKEIISSLHNVSFDIIDKYNNAEDDALKIGGQIIAQYYPDVDLAERPRYTNLENNITQQIGIILNMFCAADNQNELYSDANLKDVEKMSIEDYNKIVEANKKKELAEKKEAMSEESKKD